MDQLSPELDFDIEDYTTDCLGAAAIDESLTIMADLFVSKLF